MTFPAKHIFSQSADMERATNTSPDRKDTPLYAQIRLPVGNRKPLGSVRNVDLRRLLSNEITLTKSMPDDLEPARRIVSDPLPARPSTFSRDSPAASSSSRKFGTNVSSMTRLESEACELFSGSQTRPRTYSTTRALRPLCEPGSDMILMDHSPLENDTNVQPAMHNPQKLATDTNPISIGTTRPAAFSTSILNQRSHKTVHGQVTILPSRSLLVDFREGERRRGMAGDEVLIISPDGTQIKVFSAPHLSTPCCLAEPIAEFYIDQLPQKYWKQYNDAGLLIDRIKQRSPKLVLHDPDVKYTLMSNEPVADVELLFFSPAILSEANTTNKGDVADPARMRIRLSRKTRSMEIAVCKSDTHSKEWKKETFQTAGFDYSIPPSDFEDLDQDERKGLDLLAKFLHLCDTYESLASESLITTQSRRDLVRGRRLNAVGVSCSEGNRLERTGSTARQGNYTRTLASSSSLTTNRGFAVPPRPPKIPLTTSVSRCAQKTTHIKEKENLDPSKNPFDSLVTNFAMVDDTMRQGLSCASQTSRVESRFIPSVGWCVRQGSRVSQGGHYKIMFIDGAALDVDVDEEWAELRDKLGHVMRYHIADGRIERTVGDRMKVFKEAIMWVSLLHNRCQSRSPLRVFTGR
ncbi:uncharacterized protein BT62DRAFT_347374 [Guyanagaster necrorhizus]|uniref:Uncharacterized protein n=1 Tax=Guyanagaster necrorhizus TaxID=856835 RepID=A0A9P7VMI5_9AGAR|nr:uncharacterized protein BT62DRAFT_347374 [Guyanagaster necrorhizus MCA 3950]KAG7443055.1 hypothetical protein BT62DRAFT_347374 [Guyanagaster necrorhizus MCA 3950]